MSKLPARPLFRWSYTDLHKRNTGGNKRKSSSKNDFPPKATIRKSNKEILRDLIVTRLLEDLLVPVRLKYIDVF